MLVTLHSLSIDFRVRHFCPGLWSPNSNFGLRFRSTQLKFLSRAPEWLGPIKTKPMYYLYNWLAPQTSSVERELKCQAQTRPFKTYWLRFQPSKIAWTPAPVIPAFAAKAGMKQIIRSKLIQVTCGFFTCFCILLFCNIFALHLQNIYRLWQMLTDLHELRMLSC